MKMLIKIQIKTVTKILLKIYKINKIIWIKIELLRRTMFNKNMKIYWKSKQFKIIYN